MNFVFMFFFLVSFNTYGCYFCRWLKTVLKLFKYGTKPVFGRKFKIFGINIVWLYFSAQSFLAVNSIENIVFGSFFWNKWYFLISYCNSTGQHLFWRVQNFGLEFSEFLSFESYNGFKIGVISSIKNVLKVNKNLSLIDKEASLLPAVLVRFQKVQKSLVWLNTIMKLCSLVETFHSIEWFILEKDRIVCSQNIYFWIFW